MEERKRGMREKRQNRGLLDKPAAALYLAGADPVFAGLNLTLNLCLSYTSYKHQSNNLNDMGLMFFPNLTVVETI